VCVLLIINKDIDYFPILWCDITLSYLTDIPIFIEPSNGTNTVVDQCRGERLPVGSNCLVH